MKMPFMGFSLKLMVAFCGNCEPDGQCLSEGLRQTRQDLDVQVEKFTSAMVFYSLTVPQNLSLNLNFLAWVT